ncbi:MAG: YceI family protein [Pseudohongiellaceae bacterium]
MKSGLSSMGLALLAALLLCGSKVHAADSAASYTLTRQYGSVLFRVMFQEIQFMVGRFDDYSGTLYLDYEDLANSRLEASVNMASLNMADGDVAETLVNSSSWFNAQLFPQASFSSTDVTVTGPNQADFSGELSFMGITRPWTLHVEFFGGSDGELTGSSVGMHATGSFNRTDFGLDQYMNMAADEVAIEVNVKFNRD